MQGLEVGAEIRTATIMVTVPEETEVTEAIEEAEEEVELRTEDEAEEGSPKLGIDMMMFKFRYNHIYGCVYI